VFQRLQGSKQPKPFVFTHLGKVNEVQSSIPLCVKCVSTLDVRSDGSLKVKRRTLVITSYRTSSNSKGKIKDEEQPSSHPITIREANDLEDDTKSAEMPNTSENIEDFQHSPAGGKFLKRHFP